MPLTVETAEERMKKILVTNDDGINAIGIKILAEAMRKIGHVTVIAPAGEMSAISHALSIGKELKLEDFGNNEYSVSGTPTDCVHLGVKHILKDKVDLVVSGINKGANLGQDVHYSGTVAGAVEGSILGVPAISFSQILGDMDNMEKAADFAVELAREVLNHKLPHNPLLNVNFPPCPAKGVKLTRLGDRHYEDTISERLDEKGSRIFKIAGQPVHYQQDDDTDCQMAEDGYITVTPMHTDPSDFEAIVKMNCWDIFEE